MASAIETKRTMYRLYEQNAFGNRPQTWNSLADLLQTGGDGPFAVRCRRPNHPLFLFMIPRSEIEAVVKRESEKYNLREDELCFIRPLPEFSRTIQGELCYTQHGKLSLFYSAEPTHMRAALANSGKSVFGLQAVMTLKGNLDPGDVEHLYSLLDEYPDHVVEFTGFTQKVGLQNSRMVVWECRKF